MRILRFIVLCASDKVLSSFKNTTSRFEETFGVSTVQFTEQVPPGGAASKATASTPAGGPPPPNNKTGVQCETSECES